MWIKICGNTTLEDAQMAADAGASAAGFVFAPSPRQVTPEQVAAITPHLPAKLEKIGVFVELNFAAISAAIHECGLTGVQLHASGKFVDTMLAEKLRIDFGPYFRILKVIHFHPEADAELREASANPALDGVLIDSRTANALGGTGLAYDWKAARATLFSGQSPVKLIAAGGLRPDNVAEAIRTLEPWGVDVVTGVEAAPGRKDPEKVRDFVRKAREAAIDIAAHSVH